MSVFLVMKKREVSKHATRPATFILCTTHPDDVVSVLFTYAEANEHVDVPYELIIGFNQYFTRHMARIVTSAIYRLVDKTIRDFDLHYTIDWWYRTPSDVGAGELLIGIRLCDIREMIEGSV
jgi:hypothetical protein